MGSNPHICNEVGSNYFERTLVERVRLAKDQTRSKLHGKKPCWKLHAEESCLSAALWICMHLAACTTILALGVAWMHIPFAFSISTFILPPSNSTWLIRSGNFQRLWLQALNTSRNSKSTSMSTITRLHGTLYAHIVPALLSTCVDRHVSLELLSMSPEIFGWLWR